MDAPTWVNFVHAGYHDEAPGPACGKCNAGRNAETSTLTSRLHTRRNPNTGKVCMRCFCVTCKEGSLCKEEFQLDGGRHFQHAHLQVYRTSYDCTVRKAELERFLNTSVVMEYFSNCHVVHYLKTRKLATATPIYCHGCEKFVANAKSNPWKDRNLDKAKVCSIECLLRYLQSTANFRDGHSRKQMVPKRSPLA